MRKKTFYFGLALSLLFVCLLVNSTWAKPFYEGKTIKIIVATGPGGGFDSYGRLAARYMQSYLPGSTVIVKNVVGAGHVIGCNEIYHAKPDGLTFGTFNPGLFLSQLAGLKGIKFDLSKMSWIGSAALLQTTLIVSSKSPFRSLEDMMKADKVVLSSSGVGAMNYVVPMLLAQMLDMKNMKIATGYGGSEAQLALIRGDVQAQFASWGSSIKLIEDNKAFPIMIVSKVRPPDSKGLKLLRETVSDKESKPVVDLLETVDTLGRPFAGPPGIPKKQLNVLRQAFEKTFNDEKLLKLAKRTGRPVFYVSGEEVEQMASGVLELPSKVIDLVKEGYGLK